VRQRLRTLLILLAVLPPLLAFGWEKYSVWRAERDLQRLIGKSRQRILSGAQQARPLPPGFVMPPPY
jgi:hypothetical protein